MTQAVVQPGDVAWLVLAGSLAWPVCAFCCVQQAGQLGCSAGDIGHGLWHVASQLMLVPVTGWLVGRECKRVVCHASDSCIAGQVLRLRQLCVG